MDLRAIIVYSGLAAFIMLFVLGTYWLTRRGTLHLDNKRHLLTIPTWGWYLLAIGLYWFIWFFWFQQLVVLTHHNNCNYDLVHECLSTHWRIFWAIVITPTIPLFIYKPRLLVWLWLAFVAKFSNPAGPLDEIKLRQPSPDSHSNDDPTVS